MSATTTPISPSRFASALSSLPISSLHAKVHELRNSIAHLEKSNRELEEFVRVEQDKDCYEALLENREVVSRMEERIELVRREIVEVRGLPLDAGGSAAEKVEESIARGDREGDVEMGGTTSGADANANAGAAGTVNGNGDARRGAETSGAANTTITTTTAAEGEAEEGVYL
ncbi:hypothetical protein BCR34DRAFT_568986 [Clohesyomyces aquaticus]|uniref:Uncharacterized protein n=1 Tax=Clohesyomyces aquaticus TaxID=1231657 RepID=A0A1Y1ZFP5_9PLEO|nr:hypothetical protein BCR34DRAFT_568986 [Clohesyomyces aquaticus]